MSKILKSFGMAALLVALLAGTGMADTTGSATVSGCVYAAADYTLDVTALTATVDMGTLTTSLFDPAIAGGSVKVQAKNAWKLTAVDNAGTPSSKMKHGATALTNAFVVCGNALNTVTPATPTQIDSGDANTCEKTVTITYNQQLDAADTTPGAYSIGIGFTLGSSS